MKLEDIGWTYSMLVPWPRSKDDWEMIVDDCEEEAGYKFKRHFNSRYWDNGWYEFTIVCNKNGGENDRV